MKSYETVEPVPFGNYQLVERLAMGGMAEVYLARPTQGAASARFVALKRILPNIAADDEFIAMFIDEAKIAGQLNHANVASIFDLGKINQSYFIAMEYVSGHDLRALWDRTRDVAAGGKTALPIGLACFITKKICEGLDYAHRKRDAKGRPLGIIHRDVSPQNILVSYDGDLKIIDFGIAKAANRMVRTQTGILKGKFAYMAPEQARGEPTDHRADIFAIGVILYELLTGERAFKADSDFALLEKVRKVDVIPPRQLRPEMPKDLERIVMKALQREASDRYGWASALGADLDKLMVDQGYTSSKEELAAYLQRSFKQEFQEEMRRLKTYRALFADDEEEVAQQTRVRSVPGHDSLQSLDRANDGTEVGDAVGSSGADRAPGADASRDDDGSASADRDERGARDDDGATRDIRSGRPSDESAGADSRSTARGSARAPVLASLPSEDGVHEGDDRTQLEEPAPELPPRPAGPVVVARDEIARSNVRVVRNVPPRPPERSGSGSQKHPRAARAAEPPELADEDARTSERTFERTFERSGAHAPNGGAAVGPILAAALLGAVIGAGSVGIAVLLSARPAPDALIVSMPRQAEVKRGDVVLCEQTPCAVVLGAGAHELSFRAPGAEAIQKTVEVKDGVMTRVDVVLERWREDVRIESEPPGAQVFLDGALLPSTTPLTLPRVVHGNAVRLKLVRDGFQVLEVSRVVDDASVWRYEMPTSSTTWTVLPEPRDALVAVSGAAARDRDGKLTIAVGQNRVVEVRAERPGCSSRLEKLRATGGAEATLKLALECKSMERSGLIIQGPRRLSVRIDNVELPRSAPLDKYPLPPGTWNVILRGARNKTESYTVEIREGEFFRISSRLK